VKEHYYKILGVPFDASPDEVRTAFREKARQLHPDHNKDKNAEENFMLIQKAYSVLSNEAERVLYDQSLPASFTILPVVAQTLYSRSALPYNKDAQVLYALVKIMPQQKEQVDSNPPLNICMAVDISVSMQGALLETIKSTSIEIVRQMRPQDYFSMIAFNDRAEVVIPAMPISNRGHVETSIRMLRASGGTEIYRGLEAAYNEIQRNRSPKTVSHIILITDGRTYGDEAECLRLAEQAGLQQIGISGLGIGSQWNDIFLDRLASKSGGSTMFVSHPRDVDAFLREKVNHLGMSYANQMRFDFELAEGVELRYAFRINPEPAPLEITSPIHLGNLSRNEPVEFILDLYIPPLSERFSEINLIKGRVYFELPGRQESTQSVRLTLNRPVAPNTDGLSPPQAIIQAMSTLTLYRIQERARLAVQNGQVKEATRLLQNVATHLFSQGEISLARTVINEAENIQEKKKFSEDGDKRIKYGTRALLLPASMEKIL
jgi:Ca-activated chloride channel family protein